jgi:hypothetical protein
MVPNGTACREARTEALSELPTRTSHTRRVGQNHICVYLWCIYGIFGRQITKCTVIAYIYGSGQPYTRVVIHPQMVCFIKQSLLSTEFYHVCPPNTLCYPPSITLATRSTHSIIDAVSQKSSFDSHALLCFPFQTICCTQHQH